ncbi:hypothetical protein K5549_010487 [Capra hircus]|nr:hypothetical protein K5549_010487 [Capra hircus]
MPERPQPSGGHALERTPAGDGGRRDLGRQCSPVLGPQHHHASPNLAVAVLGGRSGPGSVPGAPAPSDPGPQATPSPSRPHWATGTRGVGGPDLGHPETASQAVPGPQEGVSGSTLDLHLGDISLVSPDKDLEEHDGRDLGPAGQRSLGGSAPVAIPGCLPRSPSLHSSSSLSASPLGSFSQSLPGPLISSAMTPPQQPPPLKSEPRALGPSVSSYNSFGLNGVPGSIWDFVSGSFSPSPSPILNAGPAASSGVNPSSAELARVRRQLDEAKRKIRQWEESWQQVKQACDAWQREAKEAKERALAADSARQLALQKKEEVEAQFRRLQEELEGRGLASALPGLSGCGDIGAIPLPKLHSLQSQLRLDLEAVDGVIFQLRAKQCVMCGERAGAVLRPCQHRVLCEPCAGSAPECAYCTGQPLPW